MSHTKSLILFAETISGKFSNAKQSETSPRDFAHINIYFRPIPWKFYSGPWLYSEQSYEFDRWSPYRQAIHHIAIEKEKIVVRNYKLSDPIRLAGAGFEPMLLNELNKQNLIERKGCSMYFVETKDGHYKGEIEPGSSCLIPWGGKISYLNSKVEFDSFIWKSIDIGFDIETNKKLWGSDKGALSFRKVLCFHDEITGSWKL